MRAPRLTATAPRVLGFGAMKKNPRPLRAAVLVLALGLAAWSAASASLESARSLLAAGELESAAAELEEVLATGADDEKATALFLLGTLAADAGDWGTASARLSEVVERFDGAPAAFEAAAMLRLVERLGEGKVAATPPATGSAAAVADPPAPATPETAPAPAATAAAEAPRGSQVPVAPAPARAPAPAPGATKILVAGDGEPPEVIEQVVGLLANWLAEQGVETEQPPKLVWWRRTYDMAIPGLIDATRDSGAAGFVHLTMRFGRRERLRLRCVSREGGEMWSEQVSGGSGFSEDHRPHDSYNPELLERLQKKIAKRVGGPCLPTSG